MSVQEYLDKHMLSRKIEDAVNAAVRAKTPDPVLFISNHMKKAVSSVITKVKARQILDSRGIPTVEVELYTNKGVFRASVPCGDSTGMYEAVELRDGDKGTYLGNAVTKAVKNINEKISEALVGMDPTVQLQIDQAMIDLDKTEKKSELGANAILAVSIAACRAGAAEKEVPLYKHIADLSGKTNAILPVPAFTVISGGKHSGNSLPVQQDIMILPTGAVRFEEALQMGSETYHHLKAVITEKYGANGCNVGEDGGFVPDISSVREGLDIVREAIGRTGYNDKIKIGIGVAATEFCIGTKYDLEFKSPNKSGQNFKSGEDMIQMYKDLCIDYPIASIEDPFDKEDWEHSKRFCGLGLCQVVGDDLLMSNPKRIERAIHESACNSLLLKINQIGTVTEAVDVVKMAKEAHWGVVVSQRFGETNDCFIADLAVALGAGQIKAGAPCRGERVAKYNQLLRIEQELSDQAVYAGEDWRL
ncbi:cytosolic enolase 3 isoform X1 [Gossypium raimondii]|uniref:cytosolic enolase 3 isoform X1 n=1 Tax=Gossypium raimondii TaxID=29730 RepID=UPI00227B7B8D|nr:cytosolic enolase 3 isoform X1 [Gossypium raimondii]